MSNKKEATQVNQIWDNLSFSTNKQLHHIEFWITVKLIPFGINIYSFILLCSTFTFIVSPHTNLLPRLNCYTWLNLKWISTGITKCFSFFLSTELNSLDTTIIRGEWFRIAVLPPKMKNNNNKPNVWGSRDPISWQINLVYILYKIVSWLSY